MKRYIIPIATFCLLAFTNIHAQESKLPCHTHSLSDEAMEHDPEYKAAQEELERFTHEFVSNPGNLKNGGRVSRVIPVVVHIVHQYGSENIPDANVYDMIRIINRDFQKENADTATVVSAFSSIIGDADLEFRLATKDPNGNCTNGITRTYDPIFTNTAPSNSSRPIVWPRNRYLNIWVVRNIASGAGGYTFLPGQIAALDGIVCRATQFGSLPPSSSGNLASRTMTHEIGHWFNLSHTWGGTNNPGLASNCNDDDGVTDTPTTIGVSGQNCNTSQITCGSLDNVQNYMDYASCYRMFTVGQVNRMDAALNSTVGQRNNLYTAQNLLLTGTDDASFNNPPDCVPVAEFRSNTTTNCEGNPVTFSDESWNSISDQSTWTYAWTFEDGIPATSSQRNPVVAFSSAGAKDVTLTVTNGVGTSPTTTKSNYINVKAGAGTFIAPYTEEFSNNDFPNNSSDPTLAWSVESPQGSLYRFQRTPNAFYSPPSSVFLNNFAYNGLDVHELISPTMDLSFLAPGSAYLNFRGAYSRKQSENEILYIYGSSDCGNTWSVVKFFVAGTLTSVPNSNSNSFVPSDTSEWKFYSVDVSNYAGEENARFKFSFDASNGNNLFLDDINLSDSNIPQNPVSLTSESENGVNLFPNPNNGEFRLDFIWEGGKINIDIVDALGKTVSNVKNNNLQNGWNSIDISGEDHNLSKGIYFIRMQSGKDLITKRFIVQ